MTKVLVMGFTHDGELHKMEVNAALLYGDLEEEFYMEHPNRFEDQDKPNDHKHLCLIISHTHV